MKSRIESLKKKAIAERGLEKERCSNSMSMEEGIFLGLLGAASEIREHYKGKTIGLCAILNAKSGRCAENCAFCAQSAHHHTDAPVYPLVSADEMIESARKAKEDGAHMFGIVTSGTEIGTDAEWNEILRAVKEIKEVGHQTLCVPGYVE